MNPEEKTFYILGYTPINIEFGVWDQVSSLDKEGKEKNYKSPCNLTFSDIRIHLVKDKTLEESNLVLKNCVSVYLDEERIGEYAGASDTSLNIAEQVKGYIICFHGLTITVENLTKESIGLLKGLANKKEGG